MSDAPAFFLPDGDDFVATVHTRGPWSVEHQHGGPPAALMARAVERFPAEGRWRVARFTVDLLRPVPIARLSLKTALLRASRSVQELSCALLDGDRVLCQARALRLRETGEDFPASPSTSLARTPEDCAPFEFPFFLAEVGYQAAMEVRMARGTFGEGPVQAWMRMRVPLVAGEEPSGLCRAVTAADSGNGLSPALDWRRYTFINPDLTLYLHRDPVDEWIGLDVRTETSPRGVGLAASVLRDRRGAFGRGQQSLLLAPRTPRP